MGLLDRARYFIAKRLPLRSKFRRIYLEGGFGGTSESVSGVGSTVEVTRDLKEALTALFRERGVRSVLDAPCGDFNWMAQVNLGSIAYHGVDIVPDLIRRNQERFGGDQRKFTTGDLRTCRLPAADLVLCRDCLVHLSYDDCRELLENLLRTGAPVFLLTTFPELRSNRDLPSGMGWRPLNLELGPFELPVPTLLIPETEVDAGGGRKALGLWRREQLEKALGGLAGASPRSNGRRQRA
jgi:hypothetical protein